MFLLKTREICLQRAYLTSYEPDLRTNRVLCRVCVYHPVEIVNVLLEAAHIVARTGKRPNQD
jgi:hypothetical protein